MKPLAMAEVEFKVEAVPEVVPVEGNACGCGSPLCVSLHVLPIVERVRKGELWAWCTVEVTGTWRGLSAAVYLSECSYDSEREFRNCMTFQDMKLDALDALNRRLAELQR